MLAAIAVERGDTHESGNLFSVEFSELGHGDGELARHDSGQHTRPILGDIAGIFAAALVVGLAGNAIARRFRRSPLPFIVPGSLMLVPGSVGYESASSLLAGQTVSGIDTAFNTVVMLLAIAYGLVASTLVLPDQPVTPGGGGRSWWSGPRAARS